MKKRLLSMFLALAMVLCLAPTAVFALGSSGDIEIDNAEIFPDENFRDYLKTLSVGTDGTLTAAELASITEMDCSYKNITSLKGIEYFTELEKLDCYYNQLTSLDVSKNIKLIILHCPGNNLGSLDISNNKELEYLDCEGNQLTSLNVDSNKKLKTLCCGGNQIESLDITNNSQLGQLECFENKLVTLDVSKNAVLYYLDCEDNRITALDVSSNTGLKFLFCKNNALTALDLGNNASLSVKADDGNTYEIAAVNGEFDLNSLPGDFDLSKATNWKGAAVVNGKLIVDINVDTVTYTYDCGNNFTANFTLKVNHHSLNEQSGTTNYHVVHTYVEGQGTVEPVGSDGDKMVRAGEDETFTFTPAKGWEVGDVVVNHKSVGAVSSYTVRNIDHDMNIEVTFVKDGSAVVTGNAANPATGAAI